MASLWSRYLSSFGYTRIEQNDESPDVNPTRTQLLTGRLFSRRFLVPAAIISLALVLTTALFAVDGGTLYLQNLSAGFSNCIASDLQTSKVAVDWSRFAYVSGYLVRAAQVYGSRTLDLRLMWVLKR